MSDPYIGELRVMSFEFAPKGWAFCDGTLLPINQNQALYSLLGTTYGGNGQTTFALPDLRGRTAIAIGEGYTPGQRGGEERHSLTSGEMPTHVHVLQGSTSTEGEVAAATGAVLGPGLNLYGSGQMVSMDPSSVSLTGTGQPHENMAPFSVLNVCIALQGIFPSRN